MTADIATPTLTFAPVRYDEAALAQYGALFAACFPDASKFTPAYLRWLYADNPDGAAAGYDAWDGERLAAHYVCVPGVARIGGQDVRVLLSLNTATHPDYQGKGLFTKLAALTYDSAREQGYDAVYGVANANSTPGFIRKLGFQLVRPLEARLGWGGVGTRPHGQGAPASFERQRSAAALAWRCANPDNPVRMRRRGALWQFDAAALSVARAYGELALPAGAAPDANQVAGGWAPARLFLGLVPDSERRFTGYPSIPQRLRPSPLNLIYRSLSGRVAQLDPSAIRFSFLDFDAY
ncbi:GNAT family N-acetyltransferase [Duganella sp. BJB488]|uniref:GNAT family N-acetyltransferase n=1 Tax=unclassified Duganella TaxID=2636909 RepID=UPI000E34F562|nr:MULTISPECIES: GNAT family N-acetyltransferase [unclassified Duganella]RFP26193.1 GNAT family N-acetyltransferase [Duganella sp. BJB489]RFP28067.1 GNAT family N-acetyltransferase [Duganella sp. BJB488]RFP37124.1 GNAT family N-acetyltransferase [Duganella sp. BJB480]